MEYFVVVGGLFAWIVILALIALVAHGDAQERREKATRIRERQAHRMESDGQPSPGFARFKEREYAKRRAALSLKANPTPGGSRQTSLEK